MPSKKQRSKKNKKEKLLKQKLNIKPLQQKQEEIDNINNQIKEIGFPETDENIVKFNVPGSFELIYGASKAQAQNFDVVIAIGCIIQGETRHFEFISNAVTQGIKDLNLNGKSPVIFCVLTDDNIRQSHARSGGKFGNKGEEAAIAALNMILL